MEIDDLDQKVAEILRTYHPDQLRLEALQLVGEPTVNNNGHPADVESELERSAAMILNNLSSDEIHYRAQRIGFYDPLGVALD